MSEPVSELDIARIRDRLSGISPQGWVARGDRIIEKRTLNPVAYQVNNEYDRNLISHAPDDVDALLAEVDRLRVENAAMRPIVEAVANGGVADLLSRDGVERCLWTPGSARELVTQARALLAKEGDVSGEPAIDFHHE